MELPNPCAMSCSIPGKPWQEHVALWLPQLRRCLGQLFFLGAELWVPLTGPNPETFSPWCHEGHELSPRLLHMISFLWRDHGHSMALGTEKRPTAAMGQWQGSAYILRLIFIFLPSQLTCPIDNYWGDSPGSKCGPDIESLSQQMPCASRRHPASSALVMLEHPEMHHSAVFQEVSVPPPLVCATRASAFSAQSALLEFTSLLGTLFV